MGSETDYFKKVRQRIKEEREKAGMSQTELSNKVGASGRGYISDIETGKRGLTMAKEDQILNVFGLSLEIIINEQEKPE
ncbi:MAG: helix-turn-helix transcriptional regulator [Bacteroidota bacterium]